MLRLLIGTGVLLMVVGFGAAGWQYWQSLPPSPTDLAAAPVEAGTVPGTEGPPAQGWLISATGGLVPAADVRSFMVQDRLVPERMVTLTVTAPLAGLLTEGEALPTEPFLPVFADIRAPQVARSLCPVLTESIAAACAVQSARVVPGSVDPVRGTARFDMELAYRLKPAATDLPDLALHVLMIDRLTPALAAPSEENAEGEGASTAPAPPPTSAEAALAAAITAATAPCAAEDHALACRLLRLSVDWDPAAPLAYEAELGWLTPLPEGMIQVGPITPPLPEG